MLNSIYRESEKGSVYSLKEVCVGKGGGTETFQ